MRPEARGWAEIDFWGLTGRLSARLAPSGFTSAPNGPNNCPGRYAPSWGFETLLEWNVAGQFGDALTHEVGVPVTYVQALRAKGHRDRLRRFSNTPITRDK